MPGIDARLEELDIMLPEVFASPAGFERKFDLVHRDGDLAYISGHGPIDGSTMLFQGKVGAEISPELAYEAARATGLSILASLREELGSLDRVESWCRALGLVNCAPGFDATPAVIDGFSDLIIEVWGATRGRHARSAIGASELPFGIPVEVEAVVRVTG